MRKKLILSDENIKALKAGVALTFDKVAGEYRASESYYEKQAQIRLDKDKAIAQLIHNKAKL